MIPDLYGQITAQDLPKAEPGLLRVLNRLQSSIQTFAQGRVSLTENVKCDVVNGLFSHGVPTQVKLTKVTTPGSVVVLGADGQFPLSAAVTAGGAGGSNVTLLFADFSATNVQATVAIYPEGTKTRSAPAAGTGWTSLTLINGWTNFGGGFPTAQYMKDILGFVHLRGLIQNIAGQAGNLVATTLPVGFRPVKQEVFWSTANAGGTGTRVDIAATGDVIPSVNVNVVATDFRSLSGITFDTRA